LRELAVASDLKRSTRAVDPFFSVFFLGNALSHREICKLIAALFAVLSSFTAGVRAEQEMPILCF
jgi:hypothetical protein